jgi:hypothetical protein
MQKYKFLNTKKDLPNCTQANWHIIFPPFSAHQQKMARKDEEFKNGGRKEGNILLNIMMRK